MSTDPAVTAAEQAVRTRVFASAAEAAVAAARPIIEAEVLARIQASPEWHHDDWGVDCIYRDAVDRAVRKEALS